MQSSVRLVQPAGPARAGSVAALPTSRPGRLAPRLIGAVAAIAMSPTAWAAATVVGGQGAGTRQPMDLGAQIGETLAQKSNEAQDGDTERTRSAGSDENGPAPEPRLLSALDEKRVIFDSYMLAQGAEGMTIDTSRFERLDIVTPGKYRVELHVNGQWRGTEDIEFRQVAGRESAQACYDRDLLTRAGVDLRKSARGQDPARPPNPMPEGPVCVDIGNYVPGAELKFDQAEQAIYLSVPQYYLRLTTSKNYVDPQRWDSGVPALLLNYNTNVFTTQSQGRNTTQAYAGLNLGANLGPLRLRHNGSVTWSAPTGARYQRGYIYGQTDLPELRSQVLVGESSTSGELFDSVSFRGAQIFSDDRMLPETQRYYAPVVRGTAGSNARVSVHQRGFLVYETTVAPGPFEINDLQVASYGGDLQVTVTEANGQARTFLVPFATTVQLLRPGVTRYSVTAGRASDPSLQGSGQYVMQGTLQHGINNMVTGYGGVAFASNYVSGLLGGALNTRFGGFGADVTWARATVPNGDSLRGSSFRVSYSKNLPNSGTSFSLLAYRYSTRGYLGLRDALMLHDAVERGVAADSFARTRSRVDANISQQLGASGGNVYLNGSSLQYWNQRGQALSFTLGYTNQWRGNTYSVCVQRVQNAGGGGALYGGASSGNSTLVSLNLSIPLGKSARGAPILSAFVTHDDSAGTQVSSGVSGIIDQQGKGSYSLSGTYDDRRHAAAGNASINWRLSDVALGASIGQGQGYRQASASAQGGLVVHPGGISMAQTLGETIGVVHAADAQGARVGYSGASVDRRGYAVVPSLIPYQLNSIDVDPKGIPDDVELKVTSRSVAPRAGSVVMLTYETRRARAVLINSRMPNGELLPFAATAIDAEGGMAIGAVGQGSRLVVRTEKEGGSIRVEWGKKPEERCVIDYKLPARVQGKRSGYEMLDLPCLPLSASGVGSKELAARP